MTLLFLFGIWSNVTVVEENKHNNIIKIEEYPKLFSRLRYHMIQMFALKSYIPDEHFSDNLFDLVLFQTEHRLSLNCICIQLPLKYHKF